MCGLLTYMNDTQAYPVEESKNDLIRKLDAAVNETKMKPVWRDDFMMYQMKQREAELRGEVKGREENAIETAKRMPLKAMPTDLIAEISGLPLTEVNALKTQMVH